MVSGSGFFFTSPGNGETRRRTRQTPASKNGGLAASFQEVEEGKCGGGAGANKGLGTASVTLPNREIFAGLIRPNPSGEIDGRLKTMTSC